MFGHDLNMVFGHRLINSSGTENVRVQHQDTRSVMAGQDEMYFYVLPNISGL